MVKLNSVHPAESRKGACASLLIRGSLVQVQQGSERKRLVERLAFFVFRWYVTKIMLTIFGIKLKTWGRGFKCPISLNLNMPLDHECQLIKITDENIRSLHSLLDESKRGGYHFLQRTIDDWHTEVNKFNKPGENIMGWLLEKILIGIGGLNIDPL